jgi:esterase/lipase superfamily enzyme
MSSAVGGCATCAASPAFDARCRLVTAPCNRAQIAAADQVLDDLFREGKPVVLYIHGRGSEPGKTLKDNIAGTLERDYGVRVLMFNWDSHVPRLLPFRRPVDKAQASAPELSDLVTRLATYRDSHPGTANVPVSLLVHSMGNITFRRAVEQGLPMTNGGGPIFTNILMTESDEDDKAHNVWVEKLRARGTILLSVNRNDGVLNRSNHHNGAEPIGISPAPPLATNAAYLDASGLVGKAHRLFTKSKLHGNVATCRIFTAMLRGEMPDVALPKGRISAPASAANKNDACFHGVNESSDEDEDD